MGAKEKKNNHVSVKMICIEDLQFLEEALETLFIT